jgi:hypothetical protein
MQIEKKLDFSLVNRYNQSQIPPFVPELLEKLRDPPMNFSKKIDMPSRDIG